MSIVFFDVFDPWESYQSCVQYIGSKDYCKKAVELLIEVQERRLFTYGDKVRFHVILPSHIDIRRFAIATDKNQRAVVIFLDLNASTVVLFYENFQLKFVDWITTETKALKNPHPTSFLTLHL